MAAMGGTVARWGGNLTSRYNWRDDVSNAANDWFWMCVGPDQRPERVQDREWGRFLSDSRRYQLEVNLCIPIGDWVAKRPEPGQVLGSFPVSVYGPQQREDRGLGNGVRKDGTRILDADPARANIPNSVAFQREWLETIKTQFGGAKTGPVKWIGLDNEVGLWHSTHRDVMPKGIWTTDELVRRNLEYAAMVKSVDPGWRVLGFSGWGHLDLRGSDMDWSPPGPDGHHRRFQFANESERLRDQRENRQGLSSFEWYLKQVTAAERKAGKRLIDGISLNWYTAYQGKDASGKVIGLNDDLPYDPVIAPQQFEATRGYWDPTYVNADTWTRHEQNAKELYEPFEPLLPRLRAIIDRYRPGLPLAITEWGPGSRSHFHGGLLRAIVMGTFMRENLWMANNWWNIQPGSWQFTAQCLFSNYDGQKGHVLGRFRSSTSTDREVDVVVTERPGLRHVILVNRNPNVGKQVSLPAAGGRKAQAWVYREANGKALAPLMEVTTAGDRITVTLPAFSAAVVRMER